MVSRASDWIRQAVRDLEHAKRSIEIRHFEWACFAAHQAAEKAVKALYQHLGMEVWGCSISKMLEKFPEEYRPSRQLIDKAREIDKHYIASRYPNFYPEGSPSEYYTLEEAERIVKYAEEIVRYCRDKIVQA